LFAFHPDVPKRELMAADFKEFLRAMDEHNETADADRKVRIEVRRELADFLKTFIDGSAPRSNFGGLSYVQGFRVFVGRKEFEANYYNDQVFNTGLSLYHTGNQQKAGVYLFGLSEAMDFGGFVEKVATHKPPKAGFLGFGR
jgi:hypothetical protein